MTDPQATYVEMCNWAHETLTKSDVLLSRLSDHTLTEFSGFLDLEIAALNGAQLIDLMLIRAVVDAELAARKSAGPQ